MWSFSLSQIHFPPRIIQPTITRKPTTFDNPITVVVLLIKN